MDWTREEGRSCGIGGRLGAAGSLAGGVGAREEFREVEGGTAGELGDLLPATEAVGGDDGRGAGGGDGGKEALAGNGFGDFEFTGLETEGPGHAAAAGLDELDLGAGLTEKRYFIGRTAEDRLVMAVAVEENVRAP